MGFDYCFRLISIYFPFKKDLITFCYSTIKVNIQDVFLNTVTPLHFSGEVTSEPTMTWYVSFVRKLNFVIDC